VRLERDADAVAEAPVDALREELRVPRPDSGDAEPDRRDEDLSAAAVEHAVGEHLEPQRDEHVRDRR
jgi:hypothetical protein